jgi:hypothetical protein
MQIENLILTAKKYGYTFDDLEVAEKNWCGRDLFELLKGEL